MTNDRPEAEAERLLANADKFRSEGWDGESVAGWNTVENVLRALLTALREARAREEQLRNRCSTQEAKLMRLEGESVERWKRAEAAESALAHERKTFSQSCETAWRQTEAAERERDTLRAQLAELERTWRTEADAVKETGSESSVEQRRYWSRASIRCADAIAELKAKT